LDDNYDDDDNDDDDDDNDDGEDDDDEDDADDNDNDVVCAAGNYVHDAPLDKCIKSAATSQVIIDFSYVGQSILNNYPG